jgi:hypothetical protein
MSRVIGLEFDEATDEVVVEEEPIEEVEEKEPEKGGKK